MEWKKGSKRFSLLDQQAPFNEDKKSFMAQLFEQNFSAMEERPQKQMGERFEKMQSELKGSLKDARVEVDDIEPSTSKPSPSKPSPSHRRESNRRESHHQAFHLQGGPNAW